MTTAGTYYDGPTTGVISSGTWIVWGTVTLETTSTVNAVDFVCKLWDGTNVFSSSQQLISESDNAGIKITSISLQGVATEVSPSILKISCTSNTNGQFLLYQTTYSVLNGASSLVAVRTQ